MITKVQFTVFATRGQLFHVQNGKHCTWTIALNSCTLKMKYREKTERDTEKIVMKLFPAGDERCKVITVTLWKTSKKLV